MSTAAGGMGRAYRSTDTLGRWLRGLLVGTMVSSAILSIYYLVSAADLRRLSVSLSPVFGTTRWPASGIPRAAPQGISLILSAISLVTGVVWLVWQHRSQANLHAAGLTGLAYTPGWVVGWWLIPVANFFMPFRTMRELWTRSGASADRPLVGLWWTFYMGAVVVSVTGIAFQFSSATYSGGVFSFSLRSVAIARTIEAGASLLRIVAAVFAIQIVSGIERVQEEIRTHALAHGAALPAPPGFAPPRPDLGTPPG